MNQQDINAILIFTPLFIALFYTLGLLVKTVIFKEIDCKLKIIEETKNNGENEYIIYQKFGILSNRTEKIYTNYNEAFDYVVMQESKRLELKEEKQQQKVVKRKTRLNIK